MECLVGTYEEFLLGYSLSLGEDKQTGSLKQSIANHAHGGSIRSLATSSRYLVSGGADETIRVFDMKTRREVGCLLQHNGTVTCLEFCGDTHLLSGSEDGTICVWSAKDWRCLKTLRGHKGGVIDFTVHPLGKLLLSVGKDKTLRTWNLIKGRSAYVTNLHKVATFVLWSPKGDRFLVAANQEVDIYLVELAAIVHSVNFGKFLTCASFISDVIVALGGESGKVELHDIHSKNHLHTFEAHTNRLKGMQAITLPQAEVSNGIWLVTTSSDGYIKVWEWTSPQQVDQDPVLLASVDVACRPTCLTTWNPLREKHPLSLPETDCTTAETDSTIKQDKVVTACHSRKPQNARKRKRKDITDI